MTEIHRASFLSRLFGGRETGRVLIIFKLFVPMSFASVHFLSWSNMPAMTMAFSVEAIVVAGLLFLAGVYPWGAALIAIATCAGIGAIIGFFVSYVGLHHFIDTLAAMVIARGLPAWHRGWG